MFSSDFCISVNFKDLHLFFKDWQTFLLIFMKSLRFYGKIVTE